MFVVDAPPPSYDQAIIQQDQQIPLSPFPGGGHSNPVASAPLQTIQNGRGGVELSEKVMAQSELIREQEMEIGKLKRDLGRMREQMEKMGKAAGGGAGTAVALGGEPDKLAQRLAVVVQQEAEERRRKNRSRKGDILRGSICCFALLAVLLLGLYIVLNRPSPAKDPPAKPSLEQFRVVGKALGNNLCWAEGLILPARQSMSCHIFRRSLDDHRLFCEFPLEKEEETASRPMLSSSGGRSSWSARRKGLIVIQDLRSRQRRGTAAAQPSSMALRAVSSSSSSSHSQQPPYGPPHFLLHALTDAEEREARKVCTELPLPRLLRPHPGMMAFGSAERRRRGWMAWNGRRRWIGWHQ